MGAKAHRFRAPDFASKDLANRWKPTAASATSREKNTTPGSLVAR